MPGGSVASKPTPRTPAVKSVGAGITVANRAPFAVPASANAPAEALLFIFTTPVIVPAAAAPQAAGIKPVHEPDGETPRFPVMTVSPKVVGLDTSVCAMTAYGAAVPRGVPRGMPSADARGASMAQNMPIARGARPALRILMSMCFLAAGTLRSIRAVCGLRVSPVWGQSFCQTKSLCRSRANEAKYHIL